MDVTALIIGVSGFVAALIAGLISWNNSKHTIKKDELSEIRKELVRLQNRIIRLERENEKWRQRYNQIYDYVIVLRTIMVTNNIPVPAMPKMEFTTEKSVEEKEEGLSKEE